MLGVIKTGMTMELWTLKVDFKGAFVSPLKTLILLLKGVHLLLGGEESIL